MKEDFLERLMRMAHMLRHVFHIGESGHVFDGKLWCSVCGHQISNGMGGWHFQKSFSIFNRPVTLVYPTFPRMWHWHLYAKQLMINVGSILLIVIDRKGV